MSMGKRMEAAKRLYLLKCKQYGGVWQWSCILSCMLYRRVYECLGSHGVELDGQGSDIYLKSRGFITGLASSLGLELQELIDIALMLSEYGGKLRP